ncbi:hypothetical protein GCM10010435_07270 [Winogradskya consettensis]|uniref:Mycothiol-dependent maleylpyruvate isomerase metal-binding domain-containing protein n=2 Tax=Winogradskya consettensis TaxID=113560 RepID=A0A919SMW9_9ACTN|nr:hypothetical protein Aco04nite_46970 [Actinoplanes consettensis]
MLMSDDGRDAAQGLEYSVAHALRVAETWTAWDGKPIAVEDRIYTPHKAIRRITDHLVDHLAELEARVAGQAPLADHWHASAITTPADLAPFTSEDLDEARSRLTRLAQIWSVRLRALDDERLDRVEGDAWTLRQVAFHLDDTYYADAVGDLSRG